MKKKIGLALGAGGARGFCHIGVIEVLQENDIPIHIITGCSMGALIGGGFAAGVSSNEMRGIANRVTARTVFDIDFRNMFRGGLARGNRAMNLFKKHAGKDTQIEDCNIKFAAIAADMRGHKLHVFNSGPVWEAVRASISIPAIFQPIEYKGMLLVDGGVLKRMPISEARDLGADIIIAVDAIGAPRELRSSSTLHVLDAAYQSMDWRSARFEGRDADILIVPELGNISSLVFRNNDEAIQKGREAAIKALPSIKKLLN
ncbi:MAG: patatin-like phospholipase family protein [Firmicutes bacterium]|nr:patatin-like phospholipase family protein [Bacillota bacterium]